MSQERLVAMRAPTGEIQEVPESEVDFFRKRGAVVVDAKRRRATPVADAFDYRGPGGRFDQASVPEAMMRGFVGGSAQAIADLTEGAKAGLARTAYHGGDLIRRGLGMERVIDDPEAQAAMTPPDSAAGKIGMFGEQAAEYIAPSTLALRGVRAMRAGWKGVMGAESAVNAGWAGVQSGGDPKQMMIGAVAPPAVAGAVKTARAGASMVRGMAAGAREGGFGGAVAGAVRRFMPEEPLTMIVQAVKPRNSQINFQSNIADAAPRVKAIATEFNMPLDSLDDVVRATSVAKKVVRKQFDDVAGPMRDTRVDLTPVAIAQAKSIPRSLAIDNPAAYKRALERAGMYRREVSLEEAEVLLREANAQLEGHFAKFPMSQRKQLLADPRIAAIAARAEAYRAAIYGALDHPSLPASARELNRHYGRLMEFEDALLRRQNVARRQQPESLAEQIGGIAAAGQYARGGARVLHGDMGGVVDIVGARATREAARFLKERQTTDALLRRAFAQMKPAPAFGPARPVAGYIPRGTIPLPEDIAAANATGPVADPSYARGVPAQPARREPRALLPSSTTATRTIEARPSPQDDYIKPRQSGDYNPTITALAGPVAAAGVPDDPESNLDEAARIALMAGGGAAAIGQVKAARGVRVKPFEFAPIDAEAALRIQMFKEGRVNFTALPKDARPAAIHKGILADGGYTVHPATGQRVVAGQPGPTMVGVFPNSNARTMVIPQNEFQPRHVQAFMRKNKDVFAKGRNDVFVGGWVDDGKVYLDVSRGFASKNASDNSPRNPTRAATKFGELQNPGRAGNRMTGQPTGVVRNPDGSWPKAQEAVFEPESFNSPKIGNHYEFVNSPEFQQRMDLMADAGRNAMGGDKNWWDISKGPIARVYGEENVRPMADYIATTSPQNPPTSNLRMASEYMRRHIKGEPVRQPNWRAPMTAIGEGISPGPGAKFPNEGTYAPNATRVREGRPEKLQADKVNDMFHALIGKLVGVYDRHWAKLAEAPERGIYTDSVPNRITGSMISGRIEAYPVIENAVRDAAKRNGVDVAKYSAWVWEGIRDTIRKTGKLFWQEHRADAVPETTQGFNEIFEELMREKAKHLRITVPELELRLRRGDAELLTVLLATPVGAAAFAQWRGAGRRSTALGNGS